MAQPQMDAVCHVFSESVGQLVTCDRETVNSV